MPKLHRRFKRFRQPLLTAAAEFFEAGPWDETSNQLEKFQSFVNAACAAYNAEPFTIVVLTEEQAFLVATGAMELTEGSIVLDKFSVLSLFYAVRIHLLRCGVEMVGTSMEMDAAGWSCSLFYTFKPILFRRMVREGRVRFPVHPEDLLSSETMERVRELRLAGNIVEAEMLVNGQTTLPSALTTDEEAAFEALTAQLSEAPVAPETAVSGPWNDAEDAIAQAVISGEKTVAEAATETGRTQGAVRSRIRRLREQG